MKVCREDDDDVFPMCNMLKLAVSLKGSELAREAEHSPCFAKKVSSGIFNI